MKRPSPPERNASKVASNSNNSFEAPAHSNKVLKKYIFSNGPHPTRHELLSELNAKRDDFSGRGAPKNYEVDLYIDSLEIAEGPAVHDNILDFCEFHDLYKNHAHVLRERSKSASNSLTTYSIEMVISTLMNCPEITKIMMPRIVAMLHDEDDICDSLVAALETTTHLTSFEMEIDSEYAEKAVNRVIEALAGHHGLESLSIHLPETPSVPNMTSFCNLLCHKDRLSRLSLSFLFGTRENAIQLAQVLARLPLLETLDLQRFDGDELTYMVSEWSKPQDSKFAKLQNLTISESWDQEYYEPQIANLISFVKSLPSLRVLHIDSDEGDLGQKAVNELIYYAKHKKSLVRLERTAEERQTRHPSFRTNRKNQILLAEIYLREAMDTFFQKASLPAEIRKRLIDETFGQRTPVELHQLRSFVETDKAIYTNFVSSRARWLNYRLRLIEHRLSENQKADETLSEHEKQLSIWNLRRVQTDHDREDLAVLKEIALTNPDALQKADLNRLIASS
jgi:hypothetical protein